MSASAGRVIAIALACVLAVIAAWTLLAGSPEPPPATDEIGEESREALRQVIREESGR